MPRIPAEVLIGLDRSSLLVATNTTATRLWWQYAWSGFGRSMLGVLGVLFAAWTAQIRSRECSPLVGCLTVAHATGADEVARIAILLLFVLGAMLELFCLLARPDERWRAAAELSIALSSCSWRWAMAVETLPAAASPQDYAARYVEAANQLVNRSRVDLVELPAAEPGPTRGMYALVRMPPRERWEAYQLTRLRTERQQFRHAAERARRIASRLRMLLVLLYLLGVLFAAISMLHRSVDIGFLGVVSTFLTGRATSLAARRPEAVRRAYGAAAQDLDAYACTPLVWDRDDQEGAQARVRELVGSVEEIITGVPPTPGRV
ncbi:putative membrane protein [Streptacidiphilus sp. MAP12-16]|uniref:hypothetical protein n=1 Tax=Streptacidiphilus sp. MAP12-16 TaxID=3156300 RepID=UPI0035152237